MHQSRYIMWSFVHAVGVLLYVAAVAWFGFHSNSIFGGTKDSFLAPLFVLLLFVISALTTGLLVLGRPIQLYLNGLKKEAWTMLFATALWLVMMLAGVAIIIVL